MPNTICLLTFGRNDIGKISNFGTVHVDKYMEIERFSHVMHIGSTVSGKTEPDKDALDAVDAYFRQVHYQALRKSAHVKL